MQILIVHVNIIKALKHSLAITYIHGPNRAVTHNIAIRGLTLRKQVTM